MNVSMGDGSNEVREWFDEAEDVILWTLTTRSRVMSAARPSDRLLGTKREES